MNEKKLDYYQILNFSDMYLVNEIYKRIDDPKAKDAYKRIEQEHLKPLTLSKRVMEYVRAGYLVDFIRKTIVYFIVGYFIGVGYYLISTDFFNVTVDVQRTILNNFNLSSLHMPVFIFVFVIYLITLLNYYRRNKKSYDSINSQEKVEIEDMSLQQAYRNLMCDENDEFSYIKKSFNKEIAKNKYALNKKIDAYLIVAKNYQNNVSHHIDILTMILCYMRNVITCLIGMLAVAGIIVPFLYFYINWAFGVNYTPEQTQMFLDQISATLEPVHHFVLALPFGSSIPLINDTFGMIYALIIVLGLVLLLVEVPKVISEMIRHFYRSRNYAIKVKAGIYDKKYKFYVLKDISHNKYSNKFKMFFFIVIIGYIIYYMSISLTK